MPFKSSAQRAKFWSDPKLRKFAPEWEAATPKGKKLPAYVGKQSPVEKLKRAVKHLK